MFVWSIVTLSLYIILNKWIKNHGIYNFISEGLETVQDRSIFCCIILISAALMGAPSISIPGGLNILFLCCIGLCIYNHRYYEHYLFALGILFNVLYIMYTTMDSSLDTVLTLFGTSLASVLILCFLHFDMNCSDIEHYMYGVAAIYFLRK